eukprot:CAMPEP_0171318158 /NCGR_PEP_ID=MMETSP0816-20121228/86241_1 /TAXON_ID=420281 /ORGANISM="Proboscia inermis, Strain CCAP1064/1" /LENGTH=80 /DNA_ID=CAMNT_0011812317 /DNA_START=37 /DNA_END=276 /DNA_ORIENTATION=-
MIEDPTPLRKVQKQTNANLNDPPLSAQSNGKIGKCGKFIWIESANEMSAKLVVMKAIPMMLAHIMTRVFLKSAIFSVAIG